VIGCDDDVGGLIEAEGFESRQQFGEIVVRVSNGGERSGAIDAWHEAVQAIALIVVRAVRVSGPENQHEGSGPLLEQGQDNFCCGAEEIVLLRRVGLQCAGFANVACLAIPAAAWRLDAETGRREPRSNIVAHGDPATVAGHGIDDDGLLA
jgi:hypothetical protein